MKILIRNKDSTGWKLADSVRAKAEKELQNLLIETPSLIPVDEIREGVSPLIFALSEFGLPGSGNTDVLAFTSDGDIAIIECKLAANSEIKRKVIGQILEYAAYLWGMDYNEFDNRIQKMKGESLLAQIKRAITGEWDEKVFLDNIVQTVRTGSFILIIVVDEINEDLRRIIRYLNECSESAFSLHALEMQRFKSKKMEIIVPHLYGLSTKPTSSKLGRKKWTEDEFFEVLNESVQHKIYTVIRELYDWSKGVADRIWFGTGIKTGSFTFHYLEDGKTISVFSVYTDGRLMLNYGWLSTYLSKDIMKKLHSKIVKIPSFQKIPADFSKWPSIEVADAFKNSENIEKFRQAVLWLKGRK